MSGLQARTGTQALHAGEVADLVTHFLRRGDDGVVELLQAARRHLIAVFRVVRSTRRASTVPDRSLATWTRRLVRAASAAAIASRVSSLPLALQLAGSGPVTSSTGIPESARCRVMPAP